MPWIARLRTDWRGLVFLDKAGPGRARALPFIAADPIHLIEAKPVTPGWCRGPTARLSTSWTACWPDTRSRTARPCRPSRPAPPAISGYDLRHHLEVLPLHRLDDQPFRSAPRLYDLVIAIDHLSGRDLPAAIRNRIPPGAWLRAEARRDWALRRLVAAPSAPGDTSWAIAAMPDLDGNRFKTMVQGHRLYRAGDIYQAQHHPKVPRELGADFDRLALYDALRRRNWRPSLPISISATSYSRPRPNGS